MNVSLPISDIRRCSNQSEFLESVHSVFDDVDAAVARKSPLCVNRGLCCRFSQYGHRLYVTSTELAYFLSGFSEDLRAPVSDGYCPYQVQGRCTARQHRPLGCRVYFCDPASQNWQPDLTETALKKLQTIGKAHNLPYVYLEWTEGLRAMGGELVPDDSGLPTVAAPWVKIDTPSRRT